MSIWGDVISAGGSLSGGIINAITANNTNKRNIAMQRETNALNYKMFQEQNAFNREMFNAANEWNSPQNQRKMLEEAGYNPSALLDGGASAPAHAMQSASPSPAVAPEAKMLDLGSIVNNAIQAYAAIKQSRVSDAEARKANAEADGLAIDNVTKGAINVATLKSLGKNTEKTEKEIENLGYKNIVDSSSIEADILAREETANNLLATAQKTQSEASMAEIKADIEKEYAPKRAEQEYQNLCKEFEHLVAQIGTEQAQQYMYKKTGDANWLNAKTNQAVGASQIRANNAQALVSKEMAEKLHFEGGSAAIDFNIKSQFGEDMASADLVAKLNSNKLQEQEYALNKMLLDWYKDHPNAYGFKQWVETYVSPFLSPSAAAGVGAALIKILPK